MTPARTALRSTGRAPSRLQRLADRLLTRMLRRGRGPSFMRLLIVGGRVTGQLRSTPVVPVQDGGRTWLVSPFGEVAWVRNARAAGRVDLQRGHDRMTFTVRELAAGEAVPVLRAYLSMPSERFVRRDFAVKAASSDAAILDEAARHPVFALTPMS